MFLSSFFSSTGGQNPGPLDDFYYNPIEGGSYPMTQESALRIAAVYACVDVISETAAMLPFILYERLGETGKKRAKDHPLFKVLRLQPNKLQTSIQFRSIMNADALLRGCAYARIIPGRRGFADQLKRLHPDMTTPELFADDKVRFKIRNPDGTYYYLTKDEVFVFAGKFSDGISKVNAPITLMAQTMGIASQQETHNKSQLDNGIRLSGILHTEHSLQQEVIKTIRESWESMFAGARNARKVAVLPNGIKFQQMSMTNEDAQFLEGMQFTNKQIARFFRVPPHKIGILDDATNNNIEQQALEFISDTMLPWFVRWEQAVSTQLLLDKEQDSHFAEFLIDALLRGDSTARANYYSTLVNIGAMTRNEVREKENMNPLDGLDEPLQQLNMGPGNPATDKKQPQQPKQQPKQKPFIQPKKKKPRNVKGAFSALFYGIAERVVRAEINAASRVFAKTDLKIEKMNAWADDFYSKHETFIVQAFEGAVNTYQELSGERVELESIAKQYAESRKEDLKNECRCPQEQGMADALVERIIGEEANG